MKKDIKIGKHVIGENHPTYFIADIAANHDGDIERAKSLIKLAKESGADAVKFQHHDVKKYVSDYGFKNLGGNFSHQSKRDKSIFEVDTWLGKKNKIKAISKEDYYVTINKKEIRHLTVSLNYTGPIKAPIKKGEKIAELIIKKKDENLKTLPLYASEDLKKVNFFKSLLTSVNYLIWGDV